MRIRVSLCAVSVCFIVFLLRRDTSLILLARCWGFLSGILESILTP